MPLPSVLFSNVLILLLSCVLILLKNGCGCGICYWAQGSQPTGCSGGPTRVTTPQYSDFATPMETYASKPNIRPAIEVPPQSLDYVMVTEGEGKERSSVWGWSKTSTIRLNKEGGLP